MFVKPREYSTGKSAYLATWPALSEGDNRRISGPHRSAGTPSAPAAETNTCPVFRTTPLPCTGVSGIPDNISFRFSIRKYADKTRHGFHDFRLSGLAGIATPPADTFRTSGGRFSAGKGFGHIFCVELREIQRLETPDKSALRPTGTRHRTHMLRAACPANGQIPNKDEERPRSDSAHTPL